MATSQQKIGTLGVGLMARGGRNPRMPAVPPAPYKPLAGD